MWMQSWRHGIGFGAIPEKDAHKDKTLWVVDGCPLRVCVWSYRQKFFWVCPMT